MIIQSNIFKKQNKTVTKRFFITFKLLFLAHKQNIYLLIQFPKTFEERNEEKTVIIIESLTFGGALGSLESRE